MNYLLGFVLFLTLGGVKCIGLKEEFTWSRISFAVPPQSGSPSPSTSSFGWQNSGQQFGNNFGGNRNRPQGFFPGSSDTDGGGGVGDRRNPGSRRHYVFENNIPMGANRWGNKLFITVPRRRLGVISTLNYVWINSTQRHNVPLIPYPNVELNELNSDRDGPHLVSIYRVAVDPCDRLWMVDTGLLELPNNRTQVQPPSIIIMDLHTHRIIRRYVFKESDLGSGSSLANIFVDVSVAACTDAYAYIPDLAAYGVIVYSFTENDAWRVNHNYFYLEPLAGEFLIGGHRFNWNDGVFSIGLTDVQSDGFRTAYFHSMAGTHLYSVSTRILRNRELATRSFHGEDFKVVADRGPRSQASATDLHQPTGVLFLGLVNQNALGCWNSRKSADVSNFAIPFKDDRKFIYPCDIKVSHDDLIVLSNSMPVFLYGRLNYNQTNFRVWISKVEDIIRDTACDVDRYGFGSQNQGFLNNFGGPNFN